MNSYDHIRTFDQILDITSQYFIELLIFLHYLLDNFSFRDNQLLLSSND